MAPIDLDLYLKEFGAAARDSCWLGIVPMPSDPIHTHCSRSCVLLVILGYAVLAGYSLVWAM